jgi:hypothetical protein
LEEQLASTFALASTETLIVILADTAASAATAEQAKALPLNVVLLRTTADPLTAISSTARKTRGPCVFAARISFGKLASMAALSAPIWGATLVSAIKSTLGRSHCTLHRARLLQLA